MEKKQQQFSLWSFIITFFVLTVFQSLFFSPLKKTELLDRLDVLLGGRVAEEIIYNDISTGAQNDLQRATDLSRHMITQYGMSEQLGLVTFESPRSPMVSRWEFHIQGRAT